MPEYRHDTVMGRMVIIAEERAKRPHQFDVESHESAVIPSEKKKYCPFCPGNEEQTPQTIDRINIGTLWAVRTVANKYPAVDGEDGHHEVIVDSPRHVLSIADLDGSEVTNMLRMYKRRMEFFKQDRRWQFVQIFKNVGAAAGASLPHTHSQLIVMPFVPPHWVAVLERSGRWKTEHGVCYWCQRLESELKTGDRIVEDTEHFVVLCPYVSRFAGEIEIYPKRHRTSFDETADEELVELGDLLRRTIIRLEKTVDWMRDALAYNIALNTAPLQSPNISHWHFSILPSLARAAGFEWGTGLHINPLAPEQAAKQMRNAEYV